MLLFPYPLTLNFSTVLTCNCFSVSLTNPSQSTDWIKTEWGPGTIINFARTFNLHDHRGLHNWWRCRDYQSAFSNIFPFPSDQQGQLLSIDFFSNLFSLFYRNFSEITESVTTSVFFLSWKEVLEFIKTKFLYFRLEHELSIKNYTKQITFTNISHVWPLQHFHNSSHASPWSTICSPCLFWIKIMHLLIISFSS